MTLRIGIIGAARVASYAMVAPARSVEGVAIVAVGARDFGRAKSFAATYGIPRAHGDYRSLIDDPEVDLVYVATPPHVHSEQALAVLAAGKPVLVEKPFALTAAEAERVHSAATCSGIPVFEAMHSLHHALFARVLEIVRNREIGEIREIDAHFEARIDPADPLRWASDLGGGALMDLGVYPLAWVRRIAGEGFDVIEATAEMRGGVDASFAARLDYPKGPKCRVSASMLQDPPKAILSIKGSAGELRVRNPLAPQRGNLLTVATAAGARSEQVGGPSSYEAQLVAVRNAVKCQRPFPLPPDDYVASMKGIEKVQTRLRIQ